MAFSTGSGEHFTHNHNNHSYLLIRSINSTSDGSAACTFKKWAEQPNQPGFFRIFTIISVLTILVMLVVLGNALVIAAVIMRRRLRSATGLLILSLAVADLLVGLVILPFSIANEVLHSYWIFGDTWCTMWLTMDIWMCTASIYNLVAISIDRYIAIIKPLNYPMLITKFRARCIVAVVWIGSFIICSPSFLLASSEKQHGIGKESCRCTPANSGMAYIVFSASSSFYIPMIIVIFVYVRIYIAACAATKSVYSGMMQVTATANKNPKNLLMQNPSALSRAENAPILRVHRGSTIKNANVCTDRQTKLNLSGNNDTPPIQSITPTIYAHMNGSTNSLQYIKKNRRFSQEDKLHNGELKSTDSSNSTLPAYGSVTRLRTSNDSSKIPRLRRSVDNIQQITVTDREELHMSTVIRPSTFINNLTVDNSNYLTKNVFKSEQQPLNVVAPVENVDDVLCHEDVTDETTALQKHRPLDSPLTQDFLNSSLNASPSVVSPPNGALPPLPPNTHSNNGNTIGFLHPNSANIDQKKSTKKRNYGASVWNRIIQKAPRKKAGCAYEKRLSLEIKAAKTVAIVTGCFIFCWLGFSILYGFSIETNEVVWSVVFWLGYLNSALNPVIYTVFNREFRTCFKRLLTCNHMIFASRPITQNMYNSYNSNVRSGKVQAGYSSVASAPYIPPTRSSPPVNRSSIDD